MGPRGILLVTLLAGVLDRYGRRHSACPGGQYPIEKVSILIVRYILPLQCNIRKCERIAQTSGPGSAINARLQDGRTADSAGHFCYDRRNGHHFKKTRDAGDAGIDARVDNCPGRVAFRASKNSLPVREHGARDEDTY